MYLSDTLIDQITQSLMEKIHQGEFNVGSRLPSVRKYAQILSVSNETVLRAYDKLVVLGYLEARRGSGFYVLRTHPGHQEKPVKNWIQNNPNISHWQKLLYQYDISEQAEPFDLSNQAVTNTALLQDALKSMDLSVLSRMNHYANPQGYFPLREQLQVKLAEQGIHSSADQIITTNGATDALHLVLWAHFFPEQTIVIEDPSTPLHVQRSLASGLEIFRVERLEDGPDLEALQKLCEKHKPKAFLMSSILQNPTSSCLSVYKAHQLLKMAETYDFFIIDDDTYGDLLPESQMINITRLANLDQFNRVIQIGSFSKTISAGIRSGYIAAKKETIEHILLYKSVGAIQNSLLTDELIAKVLESGKYKAHCENFAANLAPARIQTRNTLLSLGWDIPETKAGVFLWGKHTEEEQDAIQILKLKGFHFATGGNFTRNHVYCPFVRFNIE
ncbi:MAG: PLP-dependent aminotransferase family protein [Acinetobacter sp.]